MLETTYPKPIIEISNKDAFWGAKKEINTDLTIGINALGRLLMELRSEYISEDKYSLLIVPPLDLDNFKLLGKQIGFIDSRERFVAQILENINN